MITLKHNVLFGRKNDRSVSRSISNSLDGSLYFSFSRSVDSKIVRSFCGSRNGSVKGSSSWCNGSSRQVIFDGFVITRSLLIPDDCD